jgi:hypothetical protein
MKHAMQSVKEHPIQNVIITLWGDHGKECSYYSLLPALYAVRQYALGETDLEKIKSGFKALFGISYDDFTLLDLPNDTGNENWNGTGWPENPCRCLFYQDPFQGFYDWDYCHRQNYIPYGEYAEKLRAASERAGEYAYIFNYMAELCSFLEIKARLGIRTRVLCTYKTNFWRRDTVRKGEQMSVEAKAAKQVVIDEIKEKFDKAGSVVAVDYLGLTVAEADQLRANLRKERVDLKVYKNTLI